MTSQDSRSRDSHPPLTPVTIVCVYNDADVLRDCLVASVDRLLATSPETELITMDNREHQFTSAGAALNHGAALARHGVVVFAHQDVVLHSLTALERAAGLLLDHPDVGLVGACGIDSAGTIQGRIRDRVVLIGERAAELTPVDSVDEVLFAVRTADLVTAPLTEDPDFAWHAYAVEYGLRQATLGRSVTVADIPLTHNSLTINLARLDAAHRSVARLYPQLMPARTTCGPLPPRAEPRGVGAVLQPHRWRKRWLEESMVVRGATRGIGVRRVVLNDIRLDVDGVIAQVGALQVVNVSEGPHAFDDGGQEWVEATRLGLPVHLSARSAAAAGMAVEALDPQESLLLTNLTRADLEVLGDRLEGGVLGYWGDLGFWAVVGPAAQADLDGWDDQRARPARVLIRG